MISDSVFARYRSKGVLIDTNLLLLYVVGAFDRKEIGRFKRTSKFLPEDFDLLVQFMGFFQSVVTTPHILTEVSNLAGQIGDHAKGGVFAKIAQGVVEFREEHVSTSELTTQPSFIRFGLTDAAVLHHARDRFLVLTDDFPLSQYLQHHGVDTVNFNHLRMSTLFT
jgi:hypothetical protein